MVNGHSIACVSLAGYVFAPVMRFGFVGLGLGLGDTSLEGGQVKGADK